MESLGVFDWRLAGRLTVSLRRLLRGAQASWLTLLAVALIGGIALRVWIYRAALGIPDSDEAIVGLMVRHFRHGEITTFYWGQAYGGTQEVLLTVPVFLLVGSSWIALRIVPIGLSFVAAWLVWRVGRRTIGERAARIAAVVYCVWPPFVLYKLTHQWGFYASSVLYCGLLLLLTLRMVERPSRGRAAIFGLTLGLGAWESEQLVPIAVALILWTIWKQWRNLRRLWVAVPLVVVGGLPSLVWNLRHDWGSLSSPIADTTTYQHRLRIFASPLMPMMIGLRTPFTQELLLPAALTLLVYAAAVGLFLYGAYRARSGNGSILYVVAAVYPFVYAISPQTLFVSEPRYLVVLSPVLALLVAQVATTDVRGVAVIAAALVVSVATLQRMDTFFRTVPQVPPTAPRDLKPLISTLDRLRLDRVYADFWLAYRLDFDTRERIVASQNKFSHLTFAGGRAIASHHPFIRYRPYERKVDAARHGFIFFRVSAPSRRGFIAQLARHGYRRLVVGPFLVYAPPD